MSEVAKKVNEVIKLGLSKLLRSHDFKRAGRTWRKQVGDNWLIVNIQSSVYNRDPSGRFAVNLGVYIPVVEKLAHDKRQSEIPSGDSGTERVRLGKLVHGKDHWWEIEAHTDLMAISDEIVDQMENIGLPWLIENSDIKFLADKHQGSTSFVAFSFSMLSGDEQGVVTRIEKLLETKPRHAENIIKWATKNGLDIKYSTAHDTDATNGMTTSLTELIERMTDKNTGVTSSADSVSWHAHREAEQISDPVILKEAMDAVTLEQDKKKRRALYFVIGKTALKHSDPEHATFLIGRLTSETDKEVLSGLLDHIAVLKKSDSVDLTPITDLIQDKRWLVRHSAIKALKETKSSDAEDALIRLLQQSTDKHDISFSIYVLNGIGTARALPVIEPFMKSRKRNHKAAAIHAVEEIKAREG